MPPTGPDHSADLRAIPIESAIVESAFALAPIGVTITRDGITEHCNPAYLRMFGYEGHEDEIYGKSLLMMLAPESRPAVVALIEARRAGANQDASFDTVGLRRDGTTFPFHVVVRRLMLGGRPATLAFFFDLTERRAIEEDLRRTRDQLSALVEACPVPTMLLDPEGRVQVWNRAAVEAFGWSQEEAIGRVNPLVRSEHRDEYARNVAAALASGLRGVTARRRRKDGAEVDLEIFAAPVHDAAGQAIGMMAITVDVTERLRTEEALRRSEEQLRHAQKMEAVGRLAGGVAHDFNNLLTVISGLAEAMARGAGTGRDTADTLAELRRTVDRAAALTRQLLAFSRRQVLEPQDLDLGAVVRAMQPMLRTLVGPEIALVLETAPDLGVTRADPGQLEQVIANLAVNAHDAMPTGGTLSIRAINADVGDELAGERFPVPRGSYVAVIVTDVGVGMGPEVLARLFEPFFTTKERGKGTGLGLSTVFGIVKQSGGHVRVTSSPGRGSTFEVYLPRASAAPFVAPVAARKDAVVSAATVVLVEDDAMIRSLIRDMLERAGLTVLEARDAEHALVLLRDAKGTAPVLLTDVLMPGMSGSELAERALAEHPDLAVLFMSGYADPESFPEHIRERAAGFLAKPFDSTALLEKIADVVRPPRRAPTS